jgi:hypothetical protein
MKALLLLSSLLVLGGCGITNIPEGGTPAQPRGLFAGNFMPSCWLFCTISNSLTNTESGMSGSVTGGALSNTQTQSLKLGGGAPTPPVVPVPAAP